MLFQFQEYLTFENIYIYSSFGVLPFWLLLMAIPNSRITQIFVNSIILPIILSTAYFYVLYLSILLPLPMALGVTRELKSSPASLLIGLSLNLCPL